MTTVHTLPQAEDLIEAHLKEWLPRFMGKAADVEGIDRTIGTRLLPRAYGRIDDWPTQAPIMGDLPGLWIISSGRLGDPTYDDGVRSETVGFLLVVVTPGPAPGGSQQGAGKGVRLYDFALLNLWLQKPWLSDGLRVVEVGSVEFGNPGDADKTGTLGMATQTLVVEMATAHTDPEWLDDPTPGAPADEPEPLVPVETTEVVTDPA